MTLHVGILGCSAEGAALCYRTICTEGAKLLGPHGYPEISMITPSRTIDVSAAVAAIIGRFNSFLSIRGV
jgi:hypothetical protein